MTWPMSRGTLTAQTWVPVISAGNANLRRWAAVVDVVLGRCAETVILRHVRGQLLEVTGGSGWWDVALCNKNTHDRECFCYTRGSPTHYGAAWRLSSGLYQLADLPRLAPIVDRTARMCFPMRLQMVCTRY